MAGQATLSAARACCHRILATYWAQINVRQGCSLPLTPLPNDVDLIKMDFVGLADEIGQSLAELPLGEAGYLIGNLYTSMMPSDMRARLGAFYTPPPLVDRLLDHVTATGFNWLTGRILDPACGGAAFLAPVSIKIAKVLKEQGIAEPSRIIRHIAEHVYGYEIDPFAAWMSQVLVEIAMLGYCIAAGERLPQMTTVANTLKLMPGEYGKHDLVVGNPPYGKITLMPELRHRYAKSLFGHANLYGLFIDLAIRLTKENGCIAYVTSSSFLGGQYFKELRQLVAEKAPPLIIDFVTLRNGVFDDVLQETVLVVLDRRIRNDGTQVFVLSPNEAVGKVTMP